MPEKNELANDISKDFIKILVYVRNNCFRRASVPIPLNQFAALCALATVQATSLTEISSLLNITKQQHTTVIEKLAQQGYVEKHRDPRDRRSNIITLTERGRTILEQQNEITRHNFLKGLDGLTLGELNSFKKASQAYLDFLLRMYH